MLPVIRSRSQAEILLRRYQKAKELSRALVVTLQTCAPHPSQYDRKGLEDATRQHLSMMQAIELAAFQCDTLVQHLGEYLQEHAGRMKSTIASLERTWPNDNVAEMQRYFEHYKRAGLFQDDFHEVQWGPDGVRINGTLYRTLADVQEFVGRQ